MIDLYSMKYDKYYETGDATEVSLEKKRNSVLKVIAPLMSYFQITNYDYKIAHTRETLVIEGTCIECALNSIGAILNELVNYIWIKTYAEDFYLGEHSEDLLHILKSSWSMEDGEKR